MDDPGTSAETTPEACAGDWSNNATTQIIYHKQDLQAACQQNISTLHILPKKNIHMLRYVKGKSGTIQTRHKQHKRNLCLILPDNSAVLGGQH